MSSSSTQPRALLVGNLTVSHLRRAPRLMTKFYRSDAAIGVRSLLDSLDGQTVARAALDYGPFKHELKGLDESAIIDALRSASPQIDLPQIVYTVAAADCYPPLAELSDRDRSAVGLTETGEARIVAEIDSKLEADAATAEFWCDRLEMAALSAGYEHFRTWLIAPEGFDDDALVVLGERNAIGSSRQQIELLRQLLDKPALVAENATTYEITVAMGDEGERIAAHTLDEIAGRHAIPKKAATEIKTALIEALINASEHSLSPDRRVQLEFTIRPDGITITIANRGIRLADRMPVDATDEGTRRGWGLSLMRGLMDDVRVEPTDDGTRVVLTKRWAPEAADDVL